MPAPEDRIEHDRQVGQALIAFQLKMPTTYRLPHRLEGITADRRSEVHIDPAVFVHRFARTEGVAEKRELNTVEISLPIDVFAVHDPSFLRMQFEPTLTKPLTHLLQDKLGLQETPAVDDPIVGIAAEPHAAQMTPHPAIEGIVQEQIGEQRTDDTALRGAARPCYTFAVRHFLSHRSTYSKTHGVLQCFLSARISSS